MKNKLYVSKIFDELPPTYGLRGDPYLWEDFKQYYSTIPLPYTEEDFIKDFNNLFKQFVGEALTIEGRGFVKAYAHGGMSSGGICGEFWIEKALPLLLERLRDLNSRL